MRFSSHLTRTDEQLVHCSIRHQEEESLLSERNYLFELGCLPSIDFFRLDRHKHTAGERETLTIPFRDDGQMSHRRRSLCLFCSVLFDCFVSFLHQWTMTMDRSADTLRLISGMCREESNFFFSRFLSRFFFALHNRKEGTRMKFQALLSLLIDADEMCICKMQ